MADDDMTRTTELAPGMETIIAAGDTLVITDKEGQDFAVTARESEEAMAFLSAFDEWFYAKKRGGISDNILGVMWTEAESKFLALPLRIQRQLPSFKTMGVHVPAHTKH